MTSENNSIEKVAIIGLGRRTRHQLLITILGSG